ncbi:MAG: hypothetical protein JNN13_13425, partial [Planctomycetes bacterium]|nr:hypothetical protein [Planctomycetota bacterium]
MPSSRALSHLLPLLLLAHIAAQTAQQTVVPVNATVSTSPPSITFTWPADATASGFTVQRRLPGSASWGAVTVIPGAGAATTWTDNVVFVGARYEYLFIKSGSPAGRGIVTAGIEATALESRGRLVLLVDDTKVTTLGARL